MRRTSRAAAPAAVAAAALALAACGGESPEARLARAGEQLAEARERVEEARAELAEEREELAACRAELDSAQDELSEARGRLESAESRVAERATDVAVFRRVQSRLLAEERLETAAVQARVADGVVTLTGIVASPAQRERALEVARATAGVGEVRDRLEVEGGGPAPGGAGAPAED